MFTKSLITLGTVVAMCFSMSGAFAQNYGYGNDYRSDHRDMRQDHRDFRRDRYDRGGRGNYDRGGRGNFERGSRGNFERGGHGSWQGGHQNHFASNGHSFGSGSRGRR